MTRIDGDLVDFVFKPFYMVVDVLREFLFLLYILLGLLFLFFLAEKEFPGFKSFCEGSFLNTLRNLNILK